MTPAPIGVVAGGAPVPGRHAGRIASIDWSPLRPRPGALWRTLHHKRWHYVGLAHEDVFIGMAIVDVGWIATAFAYLFDRRERRLLADWSGDTLPRLLARVSDEPLTGARSGFRGAGARLSVRHAAGDRLRVNVSTRALRVEAELALADMPPPLLAIGPVEGGLVHATQKTTALPVQGWAEAGGRRFTLDSAWGAVDASNGLLARDTAWRWASAHRADVGFNLQQGYFGGQENMLWLDGRPIPLGSARFEFDATRPLEPWRVRTDDGLLDLVFTPEGVRAQDRNLGVARSYYVQPCGSFAGTVRASASDSPRRIDGLLGVTEDHRSRW